MTYLTGALTQRQNGVYYTPSQAAQVMAEWAVRTHYDRVLEPCFGSGVFLKALRRTSAGDSIRIYGVEMMETAYRASIASGLIDVDHAILGDYLDVPPFQVNAVIGNPPYVRLRSLPVAQERNATRAAQEALGVPMDSAGSTWMAFVLHATRFLSQGGRLSFVLPYEFTHVRYARQLWRFLGANFGSLRVVRVKERIFASLMQDVVILFADNRGASTNVVSFEAYETTGALVKDMPTIRETLPLRAVIEDRPFLRALIPKELNALLQERVSPMTSPVTEFCTFNIGYVSGHKQFFHPDDQTIADFGLPQSSLVNALTSSRELSGVGIRTSAIHPRKLFYPNGALSASDERYIMQGERDEVDSGYKCRSRTPWYKVPDVRIPNLMLSVFKDRPSLVLNDGHLVASNSVLCGFIQPTHATEQFLAAWYTSLTLLYCELQVHSLGGGVMVLIPGEVAKIRTPDPTLLPTTHLNELHNALLANSDPYPLGDKPVLIGALRLTDNEVALIREGVILLSGWRKTYRKPSGRSNGF